MKVVLLILLALTISCGKLEDESKRENIIQSAVGDFVASEDESLSEAESALIDQMCAAAQDKRNTYSALYLNKKNKTLSFSSTFTGCGSIKKELVVLLNLKSTTSGEIFEPHTNVPDQNLYFYEYETDESGVLANLCNTSDKKRYKMISSRLARKVAAVSGSQCSGGESGKFACLVVSSGSKLSGNTYKPYETSFIRFSLNAGSLGVVDFRQEVQVEACEGKKSTIKESRFTL